MTGIKKIKRRQERKIFIKTKKGVESLGQAMNRTYLSLYHSSLYCQSPMHAKVTDLILESGAPGLSEPTSLALLPLSVHLSSNNYWISHLKVSGQLKHLNNFNIK